MTPFTHVPIGINAVTPEVQRLVDVAEAIAQNVKAPKMNGATATNDRAATAQTA